MFSVDIANETAHRHGGKPFHLGLRPPPPRTQQCSVGPGATARRTCYVQKIAPVERPSCFAPGSGSPNTDCIALACRMLFCLYKSVDFPRCTASKRATSVARAPARTYTCTCTCSRLQALVRRELWDQS